MTARRLTWLLGCLVATAALALLAAHLPPAAKLLGLLAIAYGATAGAMAAWIWNSLGEPSSPGLRWGAAVVVLALLGQVGLAAESFRIQRTVRAHSKKNDPKLIMAKIAIESARGSSDPTVRRQAEELWRTVEGNRLTFAEFLQYRVLALGPKVQRLGGVIWGLELVLGSTAAGWFFLRFSRNASPRLEPAGPPAKLEE